MKSTILRIVVGATYLVGVSQSFMIINPTTIIQQLQSRYVDSSSSSLSRLYMTEQQIISPFDDSSASSSSSGTTATKPRLPNDLILDLTWDNVEMVLDDMRPYLVQDGGNVVIKDIDGPVVKLELQVRGRREITETPPIKRPKTKICCF